MIGLMAGLDRVADVLLPEKVDQPKVVEPPLGELARVHELMGSPEKREELRNMWQMSEDETIQMGEVFEEIAKLHDLLRPEYIVKVQRNRELLLKRDLGYIIVGLISKVKRRFGESNIFPDTGLAFDEQVEGVNKAIDTPSTQLLKVSEDVRKIVIENTRNTYASEMTRARESVREQVSEPLMHEISLYWAWGVVRRLWEKRGIVTPQAGDDVLNDALRVIANDKIPDAPEILISQQIEENRLALLSPDLSQESEVVRERAQKIEDIILRQPGRKEAVIAKCLDILRGWYQRSERTMDESRWTQEVGNLIRNVDKSERKISELGITEMLEDEEERVARDRIENYVNEVMAANHDLNRIVKRVNDPPRRKEARADWQRLVQNLLHNRLIEVRIMPTLESLRKYLVDGGTFENLERESPASFSDVVRLVDIASEAGQRVVLSQFRSVSEIIEWLDKLIVQDANLLGSDVG